MRHECIVQASDAGSQYRCGQVGRGIQPSFQPLPLPHTQTVSKTFISPLFDSIITDQWTDRWANGWMDKASYIFFLIYPKANSID